jgi:hypothetical protein
VLVVVQFNKLAHQTLELLNGNPYLALLRGDVLICTRPVIPIQPLPRCLNSYSGLKPRLATEQLLNELSNLLCCVLSLFVSLSILSISDFFSAVVFSITLLPFNTGNLSLSIFTSLFNNPSILILLGITNEVSCLDYEVLLLNDLLISLITA